MQAMEQAGNPLLVIDDSSTIRRSAEIFLGQAGYPVLLAEDGFAALSVIREQRPVLVFCDIQMPQLDGFQTCALIRRHPEFRHLPVVLLSSRDGVFDRARGVLAGASAYLTKPFTKDSLLRTVREQLAAVSTAATTAATTAAQSPVAPSAAPLPPGSNDPLPQPLPATAELSLLTTDIPSP